MSFSVILAVLFGALLHATWNLIVKGGANKLFETGINACGAGLGLIFALPFLPLPDSDSLIYLFISCVCHFIYYLGVAEAYRVTDLSLAYTIMRGAAPMLTACAMAFLGSSIGLYGWFGVLLLSGGILTLAFQEKTQGHGTLKGTLFSLRVSLVIMGYTLADGLGARASGNSLSYICWLFFINIFPVNIYIALKYGREYFVYFKKKAASGLGGGLCSLASYGIAIWAMTVAPIALVAALRESSVIFGMLLSVIFLGEKLSPLRVCAICLVFFGACLSRLG